MNMNDLDRLGGVSIIGTIVSFLLLIWFVYCFIVFVRWIVGSIKGDGDKAKKYGKRFLINVIINIVLGIALRVIVMLSQR